MPTESFSAPLAMGDAKVSDGPPTDDTVDLRGNAGPGAPPLLRQQDLPSRYRFVADLAQGGMGRVFVVEDTVLQREVAVKEALHASARTAARFEREALLTARLQHPGIISVHELGRRPSGDPYLVMRRVNGEPLDEVVARAGTLPERLKLLGRFVSVVETVAYAHGQGVVHRDLKPANVLLGEFGETVVIDWGLAKDLRAGTSDDGGPGDDEGDEKLTRDGAVLGTPVYMSPEQARGEPAAERSDIYSLGAMLYQLLSGARPYAGKGSREIIEAVKSGPPRPLQQLFPDLPAELASVVARAMAREPADRYASAAELAEELKSFQSGSLLRAHSYSTGDMIRRFLRRHALVLSLSGAFVLVLAASGAVAVRRILTERAAAERAFKFMISMFNVSNPNEVRGNTLTAREVLDKATANLATDLANDPELEAKLLYKISGVYQALGLFARAQELTEREVEVRRKLQGPHGRDVLVARSWVGSLLAEQRKYAESEVVSREVLADERRYIGPEDAETLGTVANLANAVKNQGRFAEAEALYREAVEASTRALGPDARDTLRARGNLAGTLIDMKRYAEAEPILLDVVERKTRAFGAESPTTLYSKNSLAWCYSMQGRHAEAEALGRQTLVARRRVLGKDHPEVTQSLGNLARDVSRLGRPAEAEALTQEVLDFARRTLPPEDPIAGGALFDLACYQAAQGKRDEALANLRAALDHPARPDALKTMDEVPELASLKGDARFQALLAEARR